MALKPQGNNILAGTSLAIAQIQSPDYMPGLTGWCIFQNGNAEFNSGTFRGFIVGGSIFIYSGAPALGNPPIAWMSSRTTDPFSNTIQPGNMLAQTAASGNAQGGLIWNNAVPGAAEPLVALYPNATVGFTGNAPFVLGRVFNRGLVNELLALAFGGGGVAGSSPVQFEMFSQSKDGTVLGHIAFYDWASTNLICDINASGLSAANPSSANNAETWHAMVLKNSWANVAGFAAAKYRKIASPPNSVEVIGAINAAAATAAAFFTLPAGYIPASKQPVCSMGANASVPAGLSPWIQCDTSGNLSVQNTGALGAWESFFHGFISLDA
jgi:hypothetical protein